MIWPECTREALLQGCGGAAGASVSVRSMGLRRPDAAADGSAGAGRQGACRRETGQRSRPEGRQSWAGNPVASCAMERWPSSEPSPRFFPLSLSPALVGSLSPFAGPNQSPASPLYLGFHKVARVVLYTQPLTLSLLCFKPAMDFPPEVGSSPSSLSGVHGPP